VETAVKLIRPHGRGTRLGSLGIGWIAVILIVSMVGVDVAWAGVEEWERLSTTAIEAYRQARFVAAEAALKAASTRPSGVSARSTSS
jgi:hypothetical protein